jgi:DNA invertase Pin-like site-specific DNA recombinase
MATLIEQFIKQLDTIIIGHGGKRLTSNVDFKEQIEFECGSGHKFKKRYDEIINGSWCDECLKVRSVRSDQIEQILTAASIKFTLASDFTYITDGENKIYIDYYREGNKVSVILGKVKSVIHNLMSLSFTGKAFRYAVIIDSLDTINTTSFFSWCLRNTPTEDLKNSIFSNNKEVNDFVNSQLNQVKTPKIEDQKAATSVPIPLVISTPQPLSVLAPQQPLNSLTPPPVTQQIQPSALSVSQPILKIVDPNTGFVGGTESSVKQDEHSTQPEKVKKKRGRKPKSEAKVDRTDLKEAPQVDDTREQITVKVQDELDTRMIDIFKSTEMQASRGVKAIVGYVRVSTEEQKKYGISLSAQEDDIRRYAALCKAPIRQIYRDEGISGKNIEARPGLRECLTSLLRGEELVCSNTSRLSRNCGDTLGILNDLEKRGVKLRCLDVDGDMSKATTRLYFTLRSMLAEHERLIIAERIKSAMNYLIRGGKLKTKPPFGFKSPGKKMSLIEDPEEMAIVKHIGKMTQDDPLISKSEICRRLESAGLKCRNAKRWYIQRLTDIMRNHNITDSNGKYISLANK